MLTKPNHHYLNPQQPCPPLALPEAATQGLVGYVAYAMAEFNKTEGMKEDRRFRILAKEVFATPSYFGKEFRDQLWRRYGSADRAAFRRYMSKQAAEDNPEQNVFMVGHVGWCDFQ